ncbi:G-type lectin S-receptor-like serine/threonine-protein kinase LECRK2 [Pistacia vera]|uniref:G-type lectin S-receptor-like serine/threonine-protein kinase LECRK2 n=1 Tax=Pistacia vera TaxID=55513 RepID=UPI00126307F0|nr:G-type lectin S-receptor-like serine/threonine-protein kinase LECRK2 [Pistacia vera]
MLDTGNFVLASQDSANLWESFDNATDTILPTQIMNQDKKLYASISETNFSIGRFMFHLQNDGNLLLLTTKFPLDTPNFPYWSTQDSTIGNGFQLIFNQSGYIYVIARNGSILNMVSSSAASTQDFYQRAIVDSDGVFRRYIYPKSLAASGGRWPIRWSTIFFIPSNICLRIRGDTGSGACGLNSYCCLGEDSQKICQLAKLLKVDQTHTTTKIRGTKGYVAPEWFKNLPITSKVDVYSFGILLLELVCYRRNFDTNAEEECQKVLADWSYDCFKEGKLDLLVENDEETMEDMKRVEKFVMIAIWCIQEDPSLRLSMKKVSQMMEGTVEVSISPDPSSIFSSI